jgi:hypothetical protein
MQHIEQAGSRTLVVSQPDATGSRKRSLRQHLKTQLCSCAARRRARRTNQTNGSWKTWPPRLGDAPLLRGAAALVRMIESICHIHLMPNLQHETQP